jgi:hypothetical protein
MTNDIYAHLGGKTAILQILESKFPMAYWQEKFPHLVYCGMAFRPVNHFLADDNLGIREKGTPDAEPLGLSLSEVGFDPTYQPPMFSITAFEAIDGRTRAKETKKLGVGEIPCAIFTEKPSETPLSNKIGAGIISNKHPYAGPLGWKDFVSAGMQVVQEGEVALDRNDLLEFFEEKCDIYSFYKKGGHWITRIIDGVFKECSEGNTNVRVKSRDEWIEWLQNHGHDLSGVKLLTSSGSNSAERFFCREVLPSEKGKPAKVILFSGSGRESQVKMDHLEFVKKVKQNCRLMDSNVDSHLGSHINIGNIPYEDRFEIIGVIPQAPKFSDQYDLGKLVPFSLIK